jgi:ubiquinone/menaquinone biosynthesis C-methylase UbiE
VLIYGVIKSVLLGDELMDKSTQVKSKEFFDAQADNYNNSPAGKFVAPMYKEILHRINSANPATLLDIGCGNGNILSNLADTKISLFGLDISDNMIQIAKERLANRASLIVGDAEKLPFENESFDFILCNASFHHYPNPKKVLNEMYRVLNNKGILLIGDPNPPFFIRILMNIFIKYSNGGDFKIYGKNQFEQLLKNSGFKPTYKTCIFEAKKTIDRFIL